MGAALPAMRLRQQPQQAPQIDWSNPITRALVFAYVAGGSSAAGFSLNGQNFSPYVATNGTLIGTPVVTPIGLAVRAATNSYPFGIGVIPAQTQNYSLFAVGTGPTSGIQSAIDDDFGTAGNRKFQFRLNAGRVEFLPFNTSDSVIATVSPAAAANVAAEMAGGFTMGATASPTRLAAFQGPRTASATVTGTLATPSTVPAVGSRRTGVQTWASGGLALVAYWSRTLTDAEMRSLADNPWQLFKAQPAAGLMAVLAGGGAAIAPSAASATMAWAEDDDTHAVVGRITNRAAVAWSESDDAHALSVVETDVGTLAWAEANDVMAITCSVTNRSAVSWTEANDAVSITGSVAAEQPTNVSASIVWAEQDDGFALFMSAATGGAPGYGKQRRKYVVRKGGQLLVFSDPEEAKAALHADDEPEPVKQYPAKKQSKAEPTKPVAPRRPEPEPEQRVNLAELQALAKRQDAEAEYQRLLTQQRYDTLLKLEERLREDEEDDWLLMAAE